MPLAAVIAGRYSLSYNSLAVGLLDDAGCRLLMFPKEQEINRTDAYAQTLIETLHQGVDWAAVFKCLEYGAAAISSMISPWGTFGTLGTISAPGTSLGKSFTMTATAGTPAANSPASLTAPIAKLSQQSQVELGFSPSLRDVPVRLNFIPDLQSGTVKHFTTT